MTIEQPRWQQPPPPIQSQNLGQGVAHNHWGNSQKNPMGQPIYQPVLKPPSQQPTFPPYMGGSTPINGPTENLMPHQYYWP